MQQPAHLVGQRGQVAHQQGAGAMQGLHILLGQGLSLHEAHRRPAHGFANGGGVVAIILVAVEVRLDLVRRQQPHRVAQLA